MLGLGAGQFPERPRDCTCAVLGACSTCDLGDSPGTGGHAALYRLPGLWQALRAGAFL